MPQNCYLLFVDSVKNHNKYYKMTLKGDSFLVEYGRVGVAPQTCTYPIRQWETKYREKINKGYNDVTEFHIDNSASVAVADKQGNVTEYKSIEDTEIATLIKKLMDVSRQMVHQNYSINVQDVTQAMIDQATEYINSLTAYVNACRKNPADISMSSVIWVNTLLETKLFLCIPRRMAKVSDGLLPMNITYDADKFLTIVEKIIDNEQKLLDNLATCVQQTTKQTIKPAKNAQQTVLDANGLKMRKCTPAEIQKIKKELGECAQMFSRAWAVEYDKTQSAFETFKEKYKDKYGRFPTKLLWHGSRTENWWSILCTGLKIRPSNVCTSGSMFGTGLYFAPQARKSLRYTSIRGSNYAHGTDNVAYMALMQVAYGNPLNINSTSSLWYNMAWNKFSNQFSDYHCLHVHATPAHMQTYGTVYNDEIIVYNQNQCTIKYLVEVKS